jgi:hypothetical protein
MSAWKIYSSRRRNFCVQWVQFLLSRSWPSLELVESEGDAGGLTLRYALCMMIAHTSGVMIQTMKSLVPCSVKTTMIL